MTEQKPTQPIPTNQVSGGSEFTSAERSFPQGFLWGAATSAHQIEGNNTTSDMWMIERAKPTIFKEPSGDACNSFELWPTDLELAKQLGLSAYRFSLEWARIEPEPGSFSIAMLDHYKAMIDGCRARGLAPIVTFCHFSVPRWFAALGGWTNPEAPELFARYCDRAARHLSEGIEYAVTINEANIANFIYRLLPPGASDLVAAMNADAGKACGSTTFKCGLLPVEDEIEPMQRIMVSAHKAGRNAIKAVRNNLPVGVSLSVTDHQAAGPENIRDQMRDRFYGSWFEVAKSDDFVGVQNYSRVIWGKEGKVPPPEGAKFNQLGLEVYPPSLAGAVRHVYAATGVPILVTEHGICTSDDAERAQFIRDSLLELHKTVAEGVPVKGYCHWSLLDNFEWLFGYDQHYGLCSVDRNTFQRTPKPSAYALGEIARRNAIS